MLPSRGLPMFLKKDLDELLANDAQPAVSLYLPTHVAGREIRQDAIRLKNLRAQEAERLRAEWRRSEVDTFLSPVDTVVEEDDFWRHQEVGLTVFLAPSFSRVHKLPLVVTEELVVGIHFHIKSLLPILDDPGPFRLLTISTRHTRLYSRLALDFRRSRRDRLAARRRPNRRRYSVREHAVCGSDRPQLRRAGRGAEPWRNARGIAQDRADRAVASDCGHARAEHPCR